MGTFYTTFIANTSRVFFYITITRRFTPADMDLVTTALIITIIVHYKDLEK